MKKRMGILPLLLACFVAQTVQRAEATSPAFIFDASVRPFQCSGATATVVHVSESDLGIVGDNSHNFIDVTNVVDGADAGFAIFDIFGANHNQNAILENSVEIYFIERKSSIKRAKVQVDMCFQPQLGTDEIVTISEPLSDWKMGGGGRANELRAFKSVKEIWGNRPGLPNLKRMSLHVKGRGQILFGVVLLRMEGNVVNLQSELVVFPAPCQLFNDCNTLR